MGNPLHGPTLQDPQPHVILERPCGSPSSLPSSVVSCVIRLSILVLKASAYGGAAALCR